jgi:hypothetical protein
LHRGGYDVQPVYSTRGEGKKTYTERDIDVLAAHFVVQGRDLHKKDLHRQDQGEVGLVFAAGGSVCRGEEFEILSGFEEPESAVGGVSGGVGVAGG